MSREDQKAQERAEKRARQKARREAKKAGKAMELLYKPIEDWDEEELARGRPRAKDGTFKGRGPTWVTREVHEEAVRRFTNLAQNDLRALVPEALKTIETLLQSTETDDNGKPLVPASVKLQAASWVVEHLVGKPTQRIEADISVKLQGILGNVMVSPDDGGGYKPAIDVVSWIEDPDEDVSSSES